ncbi:MAG: GntP family permease [Planctomycetia bacterium]|nr:GntP family permease [Planctomycetia bacterium]
MEVQISTFGAVAGLLLSVLFIIGRMHPVYSLMIGALAGGLIGGNELGATVSCMIAGSGQMMQAVLRILGAGVLVGSLVYTGAANIIARTLVSYAGERFILPALALATLLLTLSGVFVDIAVITVAPIALAVAARLELSRSAILLAMIGGGKAGNIMSPNPNTIVLSEKMGVPLTDLMQAGLLPAICAFIMTCLLAHLLRNWRDRVAPAASAESADPPVRLTTFLAAAVGPVAAICLLALRPLANIAIDPLVALPVGGLLGLLAMGKPSGTRECMRIGLEKMAPVALLLIGTGCLAGIIGESGLKFSLIHFIEGCGLPGFSLAPVSGILLCGATASTVAGATVASSVFGPALIELGVPALAGAIMIHTGATVCDTLPHGSFFHASGGSVQMELGHRMRLIPLEMIIGLTQTITAVLLFMP